MRTLIKFYLLQILSYLITKKKRFVVYKYGNKSDICIITGTKHEGQKAISFQTSHTGGLVYVVKKDKMCQKVRKFVGENVLTMFGPPHPAEEPPNIVLYMTPSSLWSLGFIEYFRFRKAWTGQSEANGITAITYSLK